MQDQTTGAQSSASPEGSQPRSGLLRAIQGFASPRDVGMGLLIALAALFIYLVYAGAHTRELSDPTAMDYAQIARNIARGEGFTTSFIRPLSLARVENISHHPDLLHAPLQPLWMALFFKLGEATSKMAAWSCGVAYLLSLPLVYILAVRLFDRRIALLALALYAVNYLSLQYAVSGLEVSLATLLVTVLALAVHGHLSGPEKPAPMTAALCGVAAALCLLVEYVYICVLVPVLLAVLLRGGKRRWSELAICLVAFTVIVSPWAIRNARVAGSPLFSLRTGDLASNTITYKGQALQRRFIDLPNPVKFLASHPREAWRKLRPLSLNVYDSIPNLGGPFLAGFFIAAIFMRFRGDALRNLRHVHYAWLVLVAGALCLLSSDPRLLVPLSPLVVIVGSAAFMTLLDGWTERIQGPKRKRRAQMWAIGILIGVCWFPVIAMTVRFEEQTPDPTEDMRRVCATLGERGAHPIFADQPWAFAWYGDVDAIWLPQTDADLHALEQRVGPIRYMVLSPLISTASDQEGLSDWARLYSASRQGMRVPHQRFLAGDLLGESGEWVLFGRIPEGVSPEQAAGIRPAE